MSTVKVRVIGAGFSGSVAARVLADRGAKVEIWDKRPHIGGNAFDQTDAHGVLYHPFGPHIFHTQRLAVVNFPNDHAYTRSTEWKHMTGQVCAGSTVTYEYPTDTGEPFYPVPNTESQMQFEQYKTMCEAEQNVVFIGRLAEYRYYNMDQAVASALAKSSALASRLGLPTEETYACD
jgi:UDP-galactopyranose mutase